MPIIGKLLGHSQPATTARYAHLDSDPMRRAAFDDLKHQSLFRVLVQIRPRPRKMLVLVGQHIGDGVRLIENGT